MKYANAFLCIVIAIIYTHSSTALRLSKTASILQITSLGSVLQKSNRSIVSRCDQTSAIEEFPADIFTVSQRRQGAAILHAIGAIYFFTLLAVICNDYFLPSVELICEGLNISKDVAAATFMATATTMPEFFTNIIGTFIAKSNVGVGTIIGSLTFNTLGVAAIAGIFAPHVIQLDWFPITRDCFLYAFHTALLIVFCWDGSIELWEASILVALYFVYFFIMYWNKRISFAVKSLVESRGGFCNRCLDRPGRVPPKIDHSNQISGDIPEKAKNVYTITQNFDVPTTVNPRKSLDSTKSDGTPIVRWSASTLSSDVSELQREKQRKSLWRFPEGSKKRRAWWIYTWPIKFILTMIIPHPKTYRRLYPLTFILCMGAIAVNSYMIVWMITVVGDTINIPDSVMGMTLLAAGGCMPEALSSFISVRKGDAGIGISNSLGANSLCILLSLGFPWLASILTQGHAVQLDSEDIKYTVMLLLFGAFALYIILTIGKHRLKKVVGFSLVVVYLISITFGILNEMHIFSPSLGC